jgi:hypothetical protein
MTGSSCPAKSESWKFVLALKAGDYETTPCAGFAPDHNLRRDTRSVLLHRVVIFSTNEKGVK